MRFLLLVSCLVAIVGCAAPGSSVPDGYPSSATASTVYSVPDGRSGQEVEVQTIYRAPIATRRLPALFGVRLKGGKELVPTEFAFAVATSTDAAIVRTLESADYLRYDIKSGKTTPYDFEQLGLVKAGVGAKSGYVGTTKQAGGRWTVTLLDHDALPVATLEDVRAGAFARPESSKVAASRTQPIDYLDGDVFVIHFDPLEGTKHAAIYNRQGVRITPRFPSIGTVLGAIDPTVSEYEQVGKHTAVLPLDDEMSPETAGLVWPTRDDGTIAPKPEGLLGLRPMRKWGAKTGLVFGWQALWQTPQGPRWAMYLQYVIDPAKLRATQDNAIYTDLELTARTVRQSAESTTQRTTILASEGPASDQDRPWVALTPYADGTLVQVYEQAMPVGELKSTLQKDGESARIASWKESKRRYDQEVARRERVRLQAQARAEAEAKRLENDRALMRGLLGRGKIAEAEQLAWSIDAAALAEVSRKAPSQVSLNALSAARYHATSSAEFKRLSHILASRQFEMQQAAQPSRRVVESRGSTWRPRSQAELNREAHVTRMDYINGKSNWYIP
ncbi:hypothetical protein Poly30_01250 [Planctomycetes bacterium Poly30]|uniref:Lipoprotein n=1 Tax=Saltatorellus ferox TaxID=2528018 RepID=A0A518EKL0_9BACT|nr:hypothetical protein Poly30_01250 [Planctomycetes bacterium Poly30]